MTNLGFDPFTVPMTKFGSGTAVAVSMTNLGRGGLTSLTVLLTNLRAGASTSLTVLVADLSVTVIHLGAGALAISSTASS
jgi:hypothetical protein